MKKGKINLFVDDERYPKDIRNLMGKYFIENWVIVRNYPDFCKVVDDNIGNINIVSFDHDISCEVDGVEKTGKDCADYLIEKYMESNTEFPNWFIHTQNVVGRENLKSCILTYLKYIEGKAPVFKYHSSGIINNNIV